MSRQNLAGNPVFPGLAVVGLLISGAPAAANLLSNSGFENPEAHNPGNNFPASLPEWTLVTDGVPCADGHKIVFADGSNFDGGPDRAAEGSQYYDICGTAGYVFQPFTVMSASMVSFGASFSRQDDGGGGSVEIYDATNTVRIHAAPAVTVARHESQEIWKTSGAVIPCLAAGSYVLRVNIDDTGHADAAYVNAAPATGVVGNGTPGTVTEAALDCALAVPGPPITFSGGGGHIVIPLTTTKRITRDTTIRGGNQVTLSGQGSVQMFLVDPGITLTLQDIVLDGGYSSGSGGTIRNQGTVALSGVRIRRSIADAHGGAIQNSGSLTAAGTRFEYNRAALNGGAIDNTGTLILTGCVAANNSAGIRGGGLFNSLGALTTSNCSVNWNSAGTDGGGVAVDGGSFKSTGDTVRGNRAGGGGGGLSLNADCIVENTECSLNTAAGAGGGVDVVSGSALLDGVRLYTNAGLDGGGIATHAGTTTVVRALIEYNRNTATEVHIYNGGGGVYSEAGTLTISDSRINHNYSTYAGAGVMVTYNQKVTLRNCIVSGNTGNYGQLGSQGGTLVVEDCTVGPGDTNGIWMDGGILTLARSTISGNSSFTAGGLWLRRGAAAAITNTTISGNSAGTAGGLYLESGFGGSSADLTNVTVTGNRATPGGNIFLGAGPDVTFNIKNSILANPAGGGNCAGKGVTSSRYSISSDNLCDLTGVGDRNGTNPLLGPLQDNGGPTFTHLPLAGSPALNAIPGPPSLPVDQRGRSRPAGPRYDIGAVQANAGGGSNFNLPPVSTFDGTDSGDEDGDGSTDQVELLAGTDPADPASTFRLTPSLTNPLQLHFPTKAGAYYRVYVSTDSDVDHQVNWQDAGLDTIAGDGTAQSFTMVHDPSIPRRFYILRVMANDGPWP